MTSPTGAAADGGLGGAPYPDGAPGRRSGVQRGCPPRVRVRDPLPRRLRRRRHRAHHRGRLRQPGVRHQPSPSLRRRGAPLPHRPQRAPRLRPRGGAQVLLRPLPRRLQGLRGPARPPRCACRGLRVTPRGRRRATAGT
jgi:hypothetical protein